LELSKYSFGIGDRFGHQGAAQLCAIVKAKNLGLDITPVWNKSNREHNIIHTLQSDTRKAADEAVNKLNWKNQYLVDADHINMTNVDKFVDDSNFFTLDVADYIGKMADDLQIETSIDQSRSLIGEIRIPGIEKPFIINEKELEIITKKYYTSISEASKIYRHIESKKGKTNFVTEISIDEVTEPQTPVEFLIILALISHENIPIQTIAPRFTGRFNKGVDYIGNISFFRKEFESFLLIIDYSIKEFGLPENLKLSIHSGSDKFSIYPAIKELIKKYDKGIHVKTAGTTWLEEVIGLAMLGDRPLKLAKLFYRESLSRMDELCAPYLQVIDIDKNTLPSANDVDKWSSDKFANTLRHIPGYPDYNSSFRQLMHVGYKVAAEKKEEFYSYLLNYSDFIGHQVTENIFDRHICRLFYLDQ